MSDWPAEGSLWVLVFAFMLELVLDRTVKRPVELEKLLGSPILLSIPYLNGRNPLRLAAGPQSQKAIVSSTERKLPCGAVGA